MSKTRKILTHEERIEYWSKRISSRALSSLRQLDLDLTDMIQHIGKDFKPVNDNIAAITKGYDKLMQSLNLVKVNPKKYTIKKTKLEKKVKKVLTKSLIRSKSGSK